MLPQKPSKNPADLAAGSQSTGFVGMKQSVQSACASTEALSNATNPCTVNGTLCSTYHIKRVHD